MSNIYKLQRYVNGSWVDVQLGQMNNVPVTQDTEATPALLADGSEDATIATTTNTGTTLEQYLTLSQVQDQFVSTALVRGNIDLQTVEQGRAIAIGRNSIAFGDAATAGSGAVAFGPYYTSSLSSISVPGYWHTEDGAEEVFYMKIDDLDDKVSSVISDLEKLIIRATVENTTYSLVITQVTPYNSDSYKFSFSTAIGDWMQFRTIISGLALSSDSELIKAQFTFIEDVARGTNSFITGQFNVALGTNSSALGKGLKTTSTNQTVVGQYNTDSDALFVVGGGESDDRKNVLEAYSHGVRINSPIIQLDYYDSWNPIGDNDEYSLIIPDYENWHNQFEEVRIFWTRSYFSDQGPLIDPSTELTSSITTIRLPEYDSNYSIHTSSSMGLIVDPNENIMVLKIKGGCLSATINGSQESFSWTNPNMGAPSFILEFIKPRN